MTTSARSAIRSVILPLPSSPHWAPTTTSPGTASEHLFRSSVRHVSVSVHSASRTAAPYCSRELALPVHVGELRIARQEREDDLPHGAVAVLGDDDVRFAGALGV